MIKLSLIMTIYNANKYIKELLDSLVVEKSNEIEFLLINDGSTDNTLDIINEYAKQDKRIKVFTKKNGGLSDTRNYGIERAKAPYIIFSDSDDVFAKDWYKVIEKTINNELKSKNKTDEFVICSNYDNRPYTVQNILEGMYCIDNNFTHFYIRTAWSKLYRKDFILKNKLSFELNGSEDLLFNTRMISHNAKIKIIKGSVYRYRIVPGSASRVLNLTRHDQFRELLIKEKCNVYKDWDYLMEHHDINAILSMVWSICTSNSKEKKKLIKEVLDKPYVNKCLDNLSKHSYGKKNDFLLKLLKSRNINTLLILGFIIKNKNKMKYQKEDIFEEI